MQSMEGTLLSLPGSTERARLKGRILAQAKAASLLHSSECHFIWLKPNPNIYSIEPPRNLFCELFLTLNFFPSNFSHGAAERCTTGTTSGHNQVILKRLKFDLHCFELQRILNIWHLEKEVAEGQRRYR